MISAFHISKGEDAMKNNEIIRRLKGIRKFTFPGRKNHLALTEAITLVAHNTRLIVFDMDDVMWDLNAHVADMTGIPYEKFTVFSVCENPYLTTKEKKKVLDAYQDVHTYRNIRFREYVINLINHIYNEHPDCTVKIISNCGTKAIRDEKLIQLLNVLDVPEADIQLNVIDIKTQTKKKELPKDIFLLVDDSPHNILSANAVHKVMPSRRHNDGLVVGGYLAGQKVDNPQSDWELRDIVMGYVRSR